MSPKVFFPSHRSGDHKPVQTVESYCWTKKTSFFLNLRRKHWKQYLPWSRLPCNQKLNVWKQEPTNGWTDTGSLSTHWLRDRWVLKNKKRSIWSGLHLSHKDCRGHSYSSCLCVLLFGTPISSIHLSWFIAIIALIDKLSWYIISTEEMFGWILQWFSLNFKCMCL